MPIPSATLLAALYSLMVAVSAAEDTTPVRSRELGITGRFLIYPVGERGAAKEMPVLELFEAGSDPAQAKPLRKWAAPLSGKGVRNWCFSDVFEFKGRKLTLRVSNYREDRGGWDKITVADEFMPKSLTDADGVQVHSLYREPGRPQFHFTPMRGELNDPNGLVCANGQYHLFFQHTPVDSPKSWGHAVSDDLLHWKEMPIAIRARSNTTAYSGSAIVDRDNVTGLKSGDNQGDLIIAYFTHCGHRGGYECMSFSNDNGLTFKHGPDLEDGLRHPPGHMGRDPKVLWHEPSKRWIAVVWDRGPGPQSGRRGPDEGQGVIFCSSKDLLRWKNESRFIADKGPYECPEFFALPVDGDKTRVRWILQEASGRYFIGEFDGREFKPDSIKDGWPVGFRQTRAGRFYAAQTWNDIPAADGRRIQIAWNGQAGMQFPCELTLRTTDGGLRLFTHPVREIKKLHKDKVYRWDHVKLERGKRLSFDVDEDLLDLTLVLKVSDEAPIDLHVHGDRLRLGTTKECEFPLLPRNGRISVRVLQDRGSFEVFAFDGEIYIPLGSNSSPASRQLTLALMDGEATIESLEVHGLKPAW
ncbi:MAG: glycoside hydrolase family 32 protein [Kiritimatiellaeota bacterium]|nr:glycoside hydrolase family 32 protein [Kiritimatiellota bacterium]